jgi:hypothetical protein
MKTMRVLARSVFFAALVVLSVTLLAVQHPAGFNVTEGDVATASAEPTRRPGLVNLTFTFV